MDPKFNSMEQALGLTTLEVDSLIEYSTVLANGMKQGRRTTTAQQ